MGRVAKYKKIKACDPFAKRSTKDCSGLMSSSSLLDPKRKASLKKRARCEKRKKGKSNSYDDGFDAPPQEDEQDDFDLSDPSLKVKWKQKRRKLDITSALKKYTFCTVKQDGIKLIPDLPSLPLTSYLDWSGKPYILYYNPNVDVTFRDRMVSIEFSQGLPSATSPEKKHFTWYIVPRNSRY